MKEEKDRLEKKILEMEKLVSQEKEKALLATLKNQQDEALASKVESSLKDIQEKLRRDRHEQEVQEERLTLKAKVKELEGRLVSERETWMQTLKAQMQERETQSKDVEGHFIYRLQEMERRWLDEKAQWQKIISQKEDEARALKHGAEKQKELEDELRRSAIDKEMQGKETVKLRDDIARLERDKASIESYIKAVPEREREIADLKVDNAMLRAREEKARDEVKLAEERFRRDADALSKEIGRLQSEIGAISDRKNSERDEAIRKTQGRHQAELQEKEKTLAELSGEKIRAISELLKMKGLLSRVQAINAVLEKERQALRLEKMQMAQAMAANIEDVKKYQSEVEALKAAQQAELQKYRNAYAADAGAQHVTKISELESRSQAELMAAARKHQDELAKVRAEAALAMETKIIEIRDKYEASAGEVRAGVRKELEQEYKAEQARLMAAVSQAEGERVRLQKDLDDSKAAVNENHKRLETQMGSELSSLKDQLAAALAERSAGERQIAGLSQTLDSLKEKNAALEAELSGSRRKAEELDQQLRDFSGQLEAERLNASVARDEAAQQAQSDQERITEMSAELEVYRQMESSFSERMKWALKGKKE